MGPGIDPFSSLLGRLVKRNGFETFFILVAHLKNCHSGEVLPPLGHLGCVFGVGGGNYPGLMAKTGRASIVNGEGL